MSRLSPIAIPVWAIALVTLTIALREAAALFAPVVLALTTGIVLSPMSRRIDRLGAPRALSAFLTLFLMLSSATLLLILLEPVASDLYLRAPLIWAEMRETLSAVQSAVHGLNEVSEQVSEAINEGGEPTGNEAATMEIPKLSDALLLAPGLAAWAMIFIGTLYFFLLSRREVYAWISRSLPALTLDHMIEAEREVSRYFLTITLINGGFGILLFAVLWAVDMPYAGLWGFLAFLANFIVYLGPSAVLVGLMIGGIVAFDGALSFVPAIAYLAINITESQFVTPSLIGHRMSVNPLFVFLSLVFWLWLWGPVGGIVAIPLLVWTLALTTPLPVDRSGQPQ